MKEKRAYKRVYCVIWSMVYYGGQLLFDVQYFCLVLACHFHDHVIHIEFQSLWMALQIKKNIANVKQPPDILKYHEFRKPTFHQHNIHHCNEDRGKVLEGTFFKKNYFPEPSVGIRATWQLKLVIQEGRGAREEFQVLHRRKQHRKYSEAIPSV